MPRNRNEYEFIGIVKLTIDKRVIVCDNAIIHGEPQGRAAIQKETAMFTLTIYRKQEAQSAHSARTLAWALDMASEYMRGLHGAWERLEIVNDDGELLHFCDSAKLYRLD